MINKSVIQKQKYFAADFCKSLGKQLISIINQYGGGRVMFLLLLLLLLLHVPLAQVL